MENINLLCKKRTESGKNTARRLRRDDLIPGNIIADGKADMISIPALEFNRILSGGLRQSTLFNLEVENGDKENRVYVKELQRHPISGNVLHVDFYRVTPNKKIQIKIPVETEGASIGVKAGGALEHFIRNIRIKATPETLLEVIKIDITNLNVDEAIYLRDIDIPSNWEIPIKEDAIILKISKARMIEEDEVEEAVGEEEEDAAAADGEEKQETAPAAETTSS